MSTPAFVPGTIVYYRESAALGFLEATKIQSVSQAIDGEWMYSVRNANPRSSLGDRRSMVHNGVLYFTEDELVSACTALELAEANLLQQLSRIQDQRAAICPDDTTDGTI